MKRSKESSLAAVQRAVVVSVTSALAFALTACGGSSKSSSSAQTQAVAIAFQGTPPKSITVNEQANLTAVVSNDPDNYGVDWSVSCGSAGSCGSLSAQHTSSGQSVTYFPPSTFNGNQTSVDVIAFATADHTANILTQVTVSAFANALKGTYVFHLRGSALDSVSGVQSAYHLAGAVALDGNGGIKTTSIKGAAVGGEQTFSDASRSGNATITGGNYFIGADGRGTLTLLTSDPTIGTGGSETFSMAVVSASQGLLAETDASTAASGSMELQTSTAAPTQGFAFATQGTDGSATPLAVAFGGVLNIDQSNGISGHGSVVDEFYQSALINCPAPSGVTGSVSPPDPFGAVNVQLKACSAANPLLFTGYLTDASHIALIETDINTAGPGAGFSSSGVALGQGAATGSFKSFTGNYAFGVTGIDATGFADSLNAAGLISSSGVGKVTGSLDEFMISGTGVVDSITAAYSVDLAGTGRVDAVLGFKDSGNPPAPEYLVYQTGVGNPALVLHTDTTLGATGTGLAYPQATTLAYNGNYAFAVRQMASYDLETDLTGQFSVSQSAGTLSGTLDGLGLPGVQLTGTFGTPSANGSFNGILSAPNASGTGLADPAPVDYFLIDANRGFFVETDLAYTLFGSFTARTPVCPTCP